MPAELTWEEKLDAIQATGSDPKLCMRSPGDWYVSDKLHVGGDGFLRGSYGNGTTPQEAVEQHWRIYTNLPPGRYAVANPNSGRERRLRWNGYLWQEVES